MEQVADHLMSLNNDLWQHNTQNQKHVEQDLDEVVRLQVVMELFLIRNWSHVTTHLLVFLLRVW